MTIDLAIKTVCYVLELDRDTLTCSNHCKQNSSYSDARIIVTYLLRSKKPPEKLTDIALALGRVKLDGTGDHSATLYYYRKYECYKFSKDANFLAKLEKVKNAFVEK